MHDLDSIQDIVFVNTVGGGGDESIVNTGIYLITSEVGVRLITRS